MIPANHDQDLRQIFRSAIEAVKPSKLIPQYLGLQNDQLHLGEEIFPMKMFERFFVAGAGKASAAMAADVERVLGYRITDGVVAVKTGHTVPMKYIRQIRAGHPIPDRNSVIAAEDISTLVKNAGDGDVIIFLLSGGASSLMTDVPYGCTLDEIREVFDLLIASGATIHEVNTVRKHLSDIKGGKLAKLARHSLMVTLIISDVTGNDLSIIGSGPTVADPSTFADAAGILKKFGLWEKIPRPVIDHLEKGVGNIIDENPHENDPAFSRVRNIVIGDIGIALAAAAATARELGYVTTIVTDHMEGDAEIAAKEFVDRAILQPQKTRQCLIAGGETTVKITGKGRGGRNQQLALAAAIALRNSDHISLLAAGTDGTDGPTDAAGAIVNGGIYPKAKELGMSPESFLTNNDANTFFERVGGLLITGPTQTNVMDLMITLIN